MSRTETHTALIKLNGIRVKLQDELEDYESKRETIHDSRRAELETKIGSRKVMISDLNSIELDIKDKL